MSPRQAALSTAHVPHLVTLTLFAVAAYALYSHYNSRPAPQRGLRRSNARRVPRSRPTPAGQDVEAATVTNEQLQQVLNGNGDGLPAGAEPIFIPESVAEGLTERGHAAQEARGAGDGREGRAGRRSSDQDSDYSFMPETSKETLENQNLLTLLYTIAQDQATRESYVHRGVTCNNCQTVPIRGIRYRCANCLDYDLCEVCEALDAHPKTHLFLKIRIPAPFIGSPRHAQVPCYPGQPHIMPHQIPPEALKTLGELTRFEQPEIEALYEQFKVLAETEYQDTRFGINGAISRNTFDRCFLPNSHVSPTSPNLIHDRMFAFYDSNNDNVISFDEFVLGVSFTTNKVRNPNRLRKIFAGYDLDGDGYIERKDFQRMFKAFYTLSKDVIRDIVASQGDDHYDPQHMDMVLMGRAPISAAFTSAIPQNRRGWEKPSHPDPEFPDQEDMDTRAVVSRSSDRQPPPSDGYLSREEDRENRNLDDSEIQRRARFWAFKTEDYDMHDTLDGAEGDEVVRLQFPEEERDVGSEVLFQMSMKGINELLDMLFKEKENEAVSLLEYEKREKAAEDGGKGKGKAKKEKPGKSSAKHKAKPAAAGKKSDENEKPENIPEKSVTEPAATPTPASSSSSASSTDVAPSSTKVADAPISDSEISPPPSPSSSSSSPPSSTSSLPRRFARIRDQIHERGGEGRLSFQEFEKIMSDPEKARKLEFVGTWTDLASF